MISVCIPTYNGEKFINQQLDSILIQLAEDDEIVISDDSSTDRTVEIIKAYKDKRIKLIENQTFKSPIYNLENALKYAKGESIFLADQDDIWYADKVQTILRKLKNYQLVISDCNLIDQDNKIIAPSLFEILNSRKGFIKNLIKNTYSGNCMAFNSSLIKHILPFPKRIAMHDQWIGLNADLLSSVYFCDEKLVGYRKHENNQTPFTGGVSKNCISFKMKYRIEMALLIMHNFIFKKRLQR